MRRTVGWMCMLAALSALLTARIPAAARPQERSAAPSADPEARRYVNEEFRFSIVPPEGFVRLSEEETRAIVNASRKQEKIPGAAEGQGGPPVLHTIFQPATQPDLSMRRLVIVPKYPPWKSLEEFEKNVTPETTTFKVYERKTLKVNGRNMFLLDREYSFQGVPVRQLCAYVLDLFPPLKIREGYLITFAAAAADFDEYRDGFMESLRSFRVIPPKVPPEMKQRHYAGKGVPGMKKRTPWRSPEVVLSLLFVAVCAVWFLVKRLAAGEGEGEGEAMEPGEGAPGPGGAAADGEARDTEKTGGEDPPSA